YFSLKLGPIVGRAGRVLAVDLRRVSLTFLWVRARMRGQRNIQTVVGNAADPDILRPPVDAVLICNTYHEFNNPKVILERAFVALRTGGQIVIVDRAPRELDSHGVGLERAADDLNRSGFRVTTRNDHLLTDPEGDLWWLLAAAKP